MQDANRTPGQRPAASLATSGDPANDRFDQLEGVLREGLAGIQAFMAAMPGASPGAGAGGAGGQGASLHTLGARLALLEESFARICTVVGRLEQEVLALQGGRGADGR